MTGSSSISRYEGAAYDGSMKGAVAYKDIGCWFACSAACIQKLYMRSHITAYTQDTVPGRIDSHIAYQNFRSGHHEASGNEIGGRRYISRHHDLIAMEFAGRLYDCVVPSVDTWAPKSRSISSE